MTNSFTTAEVAEIAGVPSTAVNKAVEEKVITVRRSLKRKRVIRLLPPHAVGYAAAVKNMRVLLGRSAKRKLFAGLKGMSAATALAGERIEVEPAVELNVGPLAGDAMERAEQYLKARELYIVEDETIMGGTPTIRGTRMTVYSVWGRVGGGDPIEDILEENPHIRREALEAAIIYAKTHPLVGRPGGRPWRP